MASSITWTDEKRRLGDLLAWPRNPRQIDRKQAKRLAESFDEFGQVEPLAIGPANEVYNGHQRLNVLMQQYGPDAEFDVRVASRALTEKEREKLTIYLHKGAAGTWDMDILADQFEVDDLLAWGFEPFELGIDETEQDAGGDTEPQTARAEELREQWGVVSGQMWALGEHRIVCGDCTDPAVVARVMGGERAACMWTDPPYGVSYVGGTKDALTIENDGADDLPSLLAGFLAAANGVLMPGAPFYIAHPPGERCLTFGNAIMAAGWKLHETLVWVKDSMVLGHSDYHYKHEPIYYGWLPGEGRSGRGDHAGSKWYGDNAQVSVFEIARPKRSEEHPTMKPVELVEAMLRNSTRSGDIVYEPFGGSGTTLLACENLRRRCRALELDARFVAVALQRFLDHTNIQPVLLEQ